MPGFVSGHAWAVAGEGGAARDQAARFETIDMDLAAGWRKVAVKATRIGAVNASLRSRPAEVAPAAAALPPRRAGARRACERASAQCRCGCPERIRLNQQRACPTFLPRMSRKMADRRTAYSQLTVAFGARWNLNGSIPNPLETTAKPMFEGGCTSR